MGLLESFSLSLTCGNDSLDKTIFKFLVNVLNKLLPVFGDDMMNCV